MIKYVKQETPYSCGSSAIRNCIIALDRKEVSERRIRLLSKTTKDGCDTDGLIKAIERLGYVATALDTKTQTVFKKFLLNGLKEGSAFVVVTDSGNHYVALTEYRDRRFWFVDSEFKNILQSATAKDFLIVAKNIDKILKREYYYAIKISKVA